MQLTRIFMALTFAFLLLQTGCGDSTDKDSSGKTSSTNAQQNSISIKGSDTMVHLTSTWAEHYMNEHPQSQISVTGGGSGTGIAALLNGTTDICAASRAIKDKERKLAQQKGMALEEFIVAMDGIAVIVNPANPIKTLSLEQIKKIFTGEYTNWQEVGGEDTPLLVFSRESSSGTYVFFQEAALDRADYTPRARLLPGTSALVQSVAADAGAIAYVGMGFAEEAINIVTMINVKSTEDSPAVIPTEKTVISGEYPIARPLYLYTNGKPQGLAKDFIDFNLAPAGQKIVRDTGYVPLS